ALRGRVQLLHARIPGGLGTAQLWWPLPAYVAPKRERLRDRDEARRSDQLRRHVSRACGAVLSNKSAALDGGSISEIIEGGVTRCLKCGWRTSPSAMGT